MGISAAWADELPTSESGKYYLLNKESGKYWGAENDWGTQASLVKNPEYVKLISNEDGTYNMESQVSNGDPNYYFNGSYMDGSPVSLTITQSGDYYTISDNSGYYGYDGTSTVLGKGLEANSQNALWSIFSEEEMIASLANATVEKPVDATFLILDANFGRNNRNKAAWNGIGDNLTLGGGGNGENDAESYRSTFSIHQKFTASKGVYKFTAQGFYRQDGSDDNNLPKFYINDEETVFPLRTGTENNMASACTSFKNGNYAIAPMFVELDNDGEITVGAKLENNTMLWCIWDNFELTYYGPEATLAEVKFGDLVKQVNELRAKATELKDNENVSAVTVKALEDAISSSEEIESTEEAYNSAIAALNAAIGQANKDIVNKPAIDALYALAESTNVYTSEAYTTYKAWVDELQESFDAGTLVETVENPNDNLGHRHENSFDDLLLSAWTIGGEQAANYTKSLYINVWSTEGNADGTEFRTPFFEYWTGDANSLGATNIVATLTDIPAGAYEISAWVRVRAKNGTNATNATGVTLSVNDGKSVDVTEGKGVNQFNLAEYTARGVVGDDGKLVITFDVEGDNNVSWLSFKNVKYTAIETADELLYEELNDLIAEKEIGDKVLGFEVDEYAPYTNAAIIQALAAAKAFDQDAINTEDEVLAVMDAIAAAEWTANEEEVNAVYDGNFANAPISVDSGDADKDLTWWTTTNSMRKVFDSNEADCAQIASSTSGKGLFAWNGACSYGKIEGYTMPLAAHTIYELNVKYAGWQNGAVDNFTVSVLNAANEGLAAKNLGSANGINTTLASTGKLLFTTGEAGDYTLTISGSGNFIFTDVTLYKAPATQTVEVSAAGYATFSSEYPLDLENIDGGTAYIVADDAEGEYIKLTEQTTAVPANTGLIIAGKGTVTIPVAATGNAPETNYLVAVNKETTVESGYVLAATKETYENVGFYAVGETPATVKAGQAYLSFPASEEEELGAKVLYFVFGDGTATSVEAIEVADAEADGALYNVAGQQVGKDYKGIVIKNGKKYLNK